MGKRKFRPPVDRKPLKIIQYEYKKYMYTKTMQLKYSLLSSCKRTAHSISLTFSVSPVYDQIYKAPYGPNFRGAGARRTRLTKCLINPLMPALF